MKRFLLAFLATATLFACTKGDDGGSNGNSNNSNQENSTQDSSNKIDAEDVPHDEIWYTTKDKSSIENLDASAFGANILSHTFDGKKWIIKFDAPIKTIDSPSFHPTDYGKLPLITGLYLPNSIETIYELNGKFEFEEFHVPKSLVYYNHPESMLFYRNFILERFTGYNISEDGRCIILDNTIVAYAPVGVEEYTTPKGVTAIGDNAFEYCQLRKIVISEGIKRIGHDAFFRFHSEEWNKTDKLEEVHLPSTLEILPADVFYSCIKIKAFYGNNIFVSDDNKLIFSYDSNGKSIAKYAVGSDISEYTIPEGVTYLHDGSFSYAKALKRVNFPDSYESSCPGAFENSYNIEYISGKYVLNDNRSMVIDNTLYMAVCGGLTEYTTPPGVSKLRSNCIICHPELEHITMSDDVLQSKYGLFWNTENFKTVTISGKMIDISTDPFPGSVIQQNGRKVPVPYTIYCRAITPPLLKHEKMQDHAYTTIYVPRESLEAYKNSTWGEYESHGAKIEGYDYTDLPELNYDFYFSTDYYEDGNVNTLQTATKGNGIDIILMGDAFTDRLIADGTYDNVMNTAMEKLFEVEPYKSFRNYFNVYSVKVVSPTEGYDIGLTTFGCYFGEGTLVGGYDLDVFEYAKKAIGDERMDEALIIVMMNSTAYAGTCYMYYPSNNTQNWGNGVSISYFPIGQDDTALAQVLHHEAGGHGFSKLADEYAYEYMGEIPASEIESAKALATYGWRKNVDFTSDPTEVKWSHFLSDTRYANEGLGAYEGGLTYWTGVWRPTENSIMRYNTGGFNAPSREAIYYRIHKLAYGADWQYDYEKFVEWDAKNRKAAAATRAIPYRHAEIKPTHPPVIVNKSWKDAK